MNDFPIVDISPFYSGNGVEKRELAKQVDSICRETGFLAITGHRINKATIDSAWNSARRFFDLPVEEKLKNKALEGGNPYGYIPFAVEALAKSRGQDTPPDLKETLNMGPLQRPDNLGDTPGAKFTYSPTLWPENPPELKDAFISYFRELSDLGANIMKIFALALDLPENYFDRYLDSPASAMRAINYPENRNPPKKGQQRAGAHSDYGSLTILLPEEGSCGLEIFTPRGEWQEVPVIPGAFVVNIGDMLSTWTNGRWVSTLHRVKVSENSVEILPRRQSMAFFHMPNWDTEIACIATCLEEGEKPKYPPVTAGAYLMAKFQSTVE